MNGVIQPRYVAYAAAHGRTPDEQLEHDREEFPGGCMCGFVLWISSQWTAWYESRGMKRPGPSSHREAVLTDDDHRSFDRFIGAVEVREAA